MRVSFSGRAAARGLVIVSALLMSTAAFAAPDATKIAGDLVAALQARSESKASFDSATASGDTVTVTNLKVTSAKRGDATIPAVVIVNPVERQPGGFTADSIAFDGGQLLKGDNTLKWATGLAKNAIVPAPSEMHADSKLTPFAHLTVTGITALTKKDQTEPVTIASVDVDLANIVDGTPDEAKVAVVDLFVPQGMIAQHEQAKSLLDQLGYQSLLLNVTVDAGYDAAKKEASIRQIAFSGKDIGTLTIAANVGGISRDDFKNRSDVKSIPDTATLESASVNFVDAGITNKVLDMQAKSMGATRDSLAMMLPAALPLAFGQLNITDAAFQQKVVDAATAFLKDPKSFTVSLAPSTPVVLKTLGQQAMSAPGAIPALLGIDVKANN